MTYRPVLIERSGQTRGYGCCRCQAEHFEGEPLFEAHLLRQSKDGIYSVPAYLARATVRRRYWSPSVQVEEKLTTGASTS